MVPARGVAVGTSGACWHAAWVPYRAAWSALAATPLAPAAGLGRPGVGSQTSLSLAGWRVSPTHARPRRTHIRSVAGGRTRAAGPVGRGAWAGISRAPTDAPVGFWEPTVL